MNLLDYLGCQTCIHLFLVFKFPRFSDTFTIWSRVQKGSARWNGMSINYFDFSFLIWNWNIYIYLKKYTCTQKWKVVKLSEVCNSILNSPASIPDSVIFIMLMHIGKYCPLRVLEVERFQQLNIHFHFLIFNIYTNIHFKRCTSLGIYYSASILFQV